MFETLLGGALGGLLRLAPELLKWLDRRGERAHEVTMFEKQLEMDRLRGEQSVRMGELEQDTARITGGLTALVEGIKGQSQLTGNKWIDGMNQSVRPVVTYWLLFLYLGAKASALFMLYRGGMAIPEILRNAYGVEDMALLSGVLNFWFLSRVFEKNGK